MTSQAQKIANRKNATRSSGPKSVQGKARVAKNALRHGLAISLYHFPELSAAAELLAREIVGENADESRFEKARAFADAQLDLKRIRMLRLQAFQEFQLVTPEQLQMDRKQVVGDAINREPFRLDPERVNRALVLFTGVSERWRDPDFHDSIRKLGAVLRRLDRYERRALSKRKRAARNLQLHDELKHS